MRHPAECGGLQCKTALFDEAVLFYTKPRLGHLPYLLPINRCPTDPPLTVTAEEFIRRLSLIAETAHLEPLASSRFGLHLAKALEDLLIGRRAALDVRRLSRWRPDSNLRRYGYYKISSAMMLCLDLANALIQAAAFDTLANMWPRFCGL